MLMNNRQRDAIAHVKSSLAEKNYAICHRDDLFGSDESERWDEAEAFMERFSNSPDAIGTDASLAQLINDNLSLDARERSALDDLKAKVEEKHQIYQAAMDARKKLIEDFSLSALLNVRTRRIEATERYREAIVAWKAAIGEFNARRKEFLLERKVLNKTFKPYIYHGTAFLGRPVNALDAPIRLTGDLRFLEIADHYYGEQAKMRIATVWRVAQIPQGVPLPPRKGSQLWHRDQTDTNILKLFIYFSDVTEGTGALEYIPDSLPTNSRWSGEIPLLSTTGYPPQELVAEKVPEDEILKCVGKKGTLVFVDTAGLHRGGYATTGPRVTVQSTYLRQKPLIPQNPILPKDFNDPTLTPEQIFAFS